MLPGRSSRTACLGTIELQLRCHMLLNPREFEERALLKAARGRSPYRFIFCGAAKIKLLRPYCTRIICHIEGGQLWSETWRELMRLHYSVEVGMHTYGLSPFPGCLPAGTRIGNYCSVAAGLQIFRRNHPVDRISQHPFFFNAAVGLLNCDTIPRVDDNPLIIGHDVWIGHNVTIAPGCRSIGDSAIVASGAVVASDVPAFAIVGGVPARRIRWRLSEDQRERWVASEWWLKPIHQLAGNLAHFVAPYTAPLEELEMKRESTQHSN